MSSYADELLLITKQLLDATRPGRADYTLVRDRAVRAVARYEMSQEDNVTIAGPETTEEPPERPQTVKEDDVLRLLGSLNEHIRWLRSIGYDYQATQLNRCVEPIAEQVLGAPR